MQSLLVVRNVWRGDDTKLMIEGVKKIYFQIIKGLV